jgi:hypothetical protein
LSKMSRFVLVFIAEHLVIKTLKKRCARFAASMIAPHTLQIILPAPMDMMG